MIHTAILFLCARREFLITKINRYSNAADFFEFHEGAHSNKVHSLPLLSPAFKFSQVKLKNLTNIFIDLFSLLIFIIIIL